MINSKKKKSKLPIELLIIIILSIIMVIIYKYTNLNIYIKDIRYKIIDKLTIRYEDISNDISLGINKELEEENKTLKKLFDIKENNYEMITGIVLKRNKWYESITINKGKKDGIKKNMAVIDSEGLIGKISEVGNNYSVVSLLTNSNNKVAVNINDYYGILDGYESGYLIVRNVVKDNDIKIGDKVYTNGLGGIYPSGIYIGDVSEIIDDDLELSKVIKVKLNNNYNRIKYVNVIRK